MIIHTVKRGESLSSIANQYKDNGIRDWREIYNDRANTAFRAKRRDPNSIQPGDQINIPLIAMRIERRTYLMTQEGLDKVVDAAIAKLKREVLPKVKLRLEFARNEFNVLQELINSDRFVAWTLDLLNVMQDLTPSSAALRKAEQAEKEVEAAIGGRFIPKIKSKTIELEKYANEAIEKYSAARRGLANTAENTVTGLEITKTTSFTVVSVYVGLATGGTVAAPAIMTARGATLGIPAALSMIQTAADEGGKALAGNRKQTAGTAVANILTAGAMSVVADKLFGHPRAKEFIGKLAYRIAPTISASQIGIVVKTGTVKDLLAKYMTTVGKGTLEDIVKDGVKATNGELTVDQLADRLKNQPVSGGNKTYLNEMAEWAIKTGAATAK